nr:ABC transporter substrate-binding protein [Halorussus sp. MSC15.2]
MSRNIVDIIDRRTLLKAAGGAGVTALAGCVSSTDDGSEETTETETEGTTETETESGSDGGPYAIGMVDSLTGSLSAFGERNQRGKDLALKRVNEVGINGRDLKIIVEDSESESQGGVSAAQKLVNQNQVPFLIGSVGSGVSLAIYESVVQGTDVVQLSRTPLD